MYTYTRTYTMIVMQSFRFAVYQDVSAPFPSSKGSLNNQFTNRQSHMGWLRLVGSIKL